MGDVVIVGGGPTGLWLAAELRLAGAGVTVLERRTERDTHSKGFTVHPRTMELWASRGVDELFVPRGTRVPSSHFGLLDTRMDYGALDTPFPYVLLLAQPAVEELTEGYARDLGVTVRRGHAFTGLTQAADGVVVRAEGPDGPYSLETGFVVGCDGVGSAVRAAAGIGFPGTASTAYTWIADVILDDPPPVAYFQATNEAGQVLVVPMGAGVHRVGGIDGDAGADAALPGEKEIRARLVSVTGTDFGLRDVVWVSGTGTASHLADRYRDGRVLLAGDAAHRLFPAGGMGLNVGLQDAGNLGWKLGATVRGWAPGGLLDTYHQERHPVGAATLLLTRGQTALMTAFTPESLALRAVLNDAVGQVPQFSHHLARQVSGIGVSYGRGPGDHPLVGTRAPDLRLSDGTGLFGLLVPGGYVLLDFAGPASAVAGGTAAPPGLTVRQDRPVESRADWRPVRAALIRPDGHVAWASETDGDTLRSAAATALAAAVGGPGLP
ncbi:monooxygenase [Microbispora corallina]|uniref:Aromatic compound monooxygenase YhjG n=1 Tax=Microbispora corallina TaxID=83302 RepID=A0ABQ4GB53_9ACTN|nr:FAD-dependent monooxygenase [Microbispora corallina]GIH44311.1 putative aromatic compound monooxygenase YhjG [Microbispora corallina]